jgi:uncharacterized OsmC-like protein
MAEATAARPQLGTQRVDIARVEQKHLHAVYRSEDRTFEIEIDEPASRAGTNLGPAPLGYFVMGAASCLLMQYVNVCTEQSIAIDSMKIMARAHNDREAKIFTDMAFQVSLTGSITPAEAEALARAAAGRCYVENTLERAIPLKTEVELNGQPVVTLTRGPE